MTPVLDGLVSVLCNAECGARARDRLWTRRRQKSVSHTAQPALASLILIQGGGTLSSGQSEPSIPASSQ